MKKNLGTLDKIARVILAAVIAVLFFAKVISGTLGIILLVLAIVFLFTSLINFCPLYSIFGLSTRKTQEKK